MDIQKGEEYLYARVATDEIINVIIRSVYDDYIVGTNNGYAYLIFKKNINNVLYSDRKLALKYLKEHKIIYAKDKEDDIYYGN